MKQEKIFDAKILLVLFPVIIIAAKIIRHTILKSVLVDLSAGNGMIRQILYGTNGLTFLSKESVSDAAGNASVIFRAINFFKLTTTIQFEIYISIIWNIILFAVIFFTVPKKLKQPQILFLALSVAVLNIWDFCLAKEPIQFLFFLGIYLVIINKNLEYKTKIVFVILIILLSVLTYRVYYILLLPFMLLCYLFFDKYVIKKEVKINFKSIVKILLICGITYVLIILALKVLSTETYNEIIRVRLRESVANTEIAPIFNSSNLLLLTVDYVVIILRLLFPVELLPMGVKYWPYVLYQAVISYYLIKNLKNIKINSKLQNLTLYLFIAFLLTSATFEPDFGSWVRHEAACFPLLMILSYSTIPKEKTDER